MAVLVQTIIDQTRLLSNLKNNQFYTDDDIGGFLNDAAMELDDIFTNAFEHYSQASQDFTLVGGVGFSTVALPVNFQKAQLLLKDPTTSNPVRVDPLANLAERGTGEAMPGLGRCYIIEGDTLEILPSASAAGSYRLLYTPQLGQVWPSPPDFVVRLSTIGPLPAFTASGGPGPGRQLTANANGALSVDGIAVVTGDRILYAPGFADATAGIFRVAAPGTAGTPYILQRATDFDQASSAEARAGATVRATAGTTNLGVVYTLTAFAGAVDVATQTWEVVAPVLPVRLVPWQLFIKIHTAIAIIQGRKQPMPDGMQTKMEQQRKRAIAASANRTEGVTQAPLQRRRGGWWNDMPWRYLVNLKTIKTDDPDLTTVQKNVATALASIPGQTADNFVTTRANQYRITGAETHVFVDASSNPVTVVLPTTGKAPIIKRIDGGPLPVFVQAADRALIDRFGLYLLPALAHVQLIFDGKAWWSI